MDELREALEDLFDESLSDNETLDMWNNYASKNGKPEIFYMNSIEEVLMSDKHMALREILSLLDSRFDADDEYFSIDDYFGYITSYSDWYSSECPFDREDLIDSIIETDDSYGNEQVSDLLDDYRN